MRKVAILTGSRGDYSIYSSVLDAIDKRRDIEYKLIVTGMHLSNRFGYTIDEIKKDSRKIGQEVPMLKYADTLAGMAKNTGLGIIGITEAIEKIKPDVVLVLGDRGEQLAGAVAGAHMNIPVAHLHGGEVSGTIDESIRHAITKFAHIHLVATKKSRERLIRLGERQEDIYLVGAPGVDGAKKKAKMNRVETARYFNFYPKQTMVLAVQHPVTTEFVLAQQNMEAVVSALIELSKQTVWIYPNSDAGHTKMIAMLKSRIKKAGKERIIKIHESLPHEAYLSLMKHAAFIIGNSSSGIIEAPSCGTAYILVGTRQAGREKAASILEVGYDKREILKAARKVLNDKRFMHTAKHCVKPYDPFGDANAGERVARVLATFNIKPELLQKRITY